MKKGFTLVEIVIVIAVIGILAGVLFPSFSGIVKKAHLNSDMELVDTMNLVLSSSETKDGKPANVKTVMNILAAEGIKSDWTCSAEGVSMYWCSSENKMVLVDTSENADGVVIYPENNTEIADLWAKKSKDDFKLYDNDNVDANSKSFAIDLNDVETSKTVELANIKIDGEAIDTVLSNLGISRDTSKNIVFKQVLTYPDADIKGALVYAKATSYRLDSQIGEPRIIYISIEEAKIKEEGKAPYTYSDMTPEEKQACAGQYAKDLAEAQKGAAWLLYCALHQIETGKLGSNIAIVLESNITLDASGIEWNPMATKSFTGYLGTINANGTTKKSAQIINISLTSGTVASELKPVSYGDYKYSFAGFIGNISGGAKIENLTIKNLLIDNPGADDDVQHSTSGPKNNRNCVGFIGRISGPATLKNINISASTYSGASVVGGLVGYIGSVDGTDLAPAGYVSIDGCSVSANLSSEDYLSDENCGCVGGLVGLIDGCTTDANSEFEIIILHSGFEGKTSSFRRTAGAIGYLAKGKVVFAQDNNFSGAKLDVKRAATSKAGLLITANTDMVGFKYAYDNANYKQLTELPTGVEQIVNTAGDKYELSAQDDVQYYVQPEQICSAITTDLSSKVSIFEVAYMYTNTSSGGVETSEQRSESGWMEGPSRTVQWDDYYDFIVYIEDDQKIKIVKLWDGVNCWRYTENGTEYYHYNDDGKFRLYDWWKCVYTNTSQVRYGKAADNFVLYYAYDATDETTKANTKNNWKYSSENTYPSRTETIIKAK